MEAVGVSKVLQNRWNLQKSIPRIAFLWTLAVSMNSAQHETFLEFACGNVAFHYDFSFQIYHSPEDFFEILVLFGTPLH